MHKHLLSILLALLTLNAQAAHIAGMDIPDTACIDHQKILQLNGAGVRRKMIIDVYVGALYLEHPSSDITAIMQSETRKRIALYFIYDEVTKEKLLEGWRDGFVLNHTATQLAALQSRLDESSRMFRSVHAGDTIYADYIPGIGTRIIINDELAGTLPGHDFYQAVLQVWLGEHPAQLQLKQGMLGNHQAADTVARH
jgi:hypothetical protein